MYNVDKVIKHIEHLGFHVLIKIDKKDETILMLEDSIFLVSKISKIRKYLKSSFNYDLNWSTNNIRYNNEYCNFIVLNIAKSNEKQILAS